jgi:hypothetical protein
MVTPAEIGRRHIGRVRRSGEHIMRRASAGGRPLPSFLIIGAQKAGTTSLHAYLSQHTEVSSPVTKELHFFDHQFARGTGWYRAHFPRSRSDTVITGESTPYYLFHPLAPARAAEVLPGCKLIVVLRNPIDRAYSHHNYACGLGFEELGFEQALAAEAKRLEGEEELLLADPNYRSWAHQHYSYLSRGRYAGQLERWLELFAPERLLVLSAEDLFAEPLRVVSETQRFLGLELEAPADMEAKNARSYAPIPAAARAELSAAFEPHNQRLYRLVGRDFGWD